MEEHHRTILIDAANEAFAGMRAYHTSEITHKQQTVGILTTTLAGNGALIAASFGALDHVAVVGWPIMAMAAVGLFLATALFSYIILRATLDKMNTDAARYGEFKQQSIKARTLLGLYQDITTPYGTERVYPEPAESKGTKKTQAILWAFFWMVILFTLAGWLAVTISWYAADLGT